MKEGKKRRGGKKGPKGGGGRGGRSRSVLVVNLPPRDKERGKGEKEEQRRGGGDAEKPRIPPQVSYFLVAM